MASNATGALLHWAAAVLEAYGEIIFRAWSTCTGACLLNVQQNCIQVRGCGIGSFC